MKYEDCIHPIQKDCKYFERCYAWWNFFYFMRLGFNIDNIFTKMCVQNKCLTCSLAVNRLASGTEKEFTTT